MINFFRKIRKQMADDNKPMKYLKYAIGEILLVMVGILLALQVNNWNEHRKTKKVEMVLISQLLEDAKADSVFFQSRIQYQKLRDTLFNNIINLSNGIKVDSIGKLNFNLDDIRFLLFNRLAYQSNLINNNPKAYDFISDSHIKEKIRTYHAKYDYVEASIEMANRINEEYGVPLEIKYFEKTSLLNDQFTISKLDFIFDNRETVAKLNLFKNNGVNYLLQTENFLKTNQ